MGAALLLAAMAGAWVQAGVAEEPRLSAEQTLALDTRLDRESAIIRASVAGLAVKLGELQARLIAMDGVRLRVAEAAGLSYTDPEIPRHSILGDGSIMDGGSLTRGGELPGDGLLSAGGSLLAGGSPWEEGSVMDDIPTQAPQVDSAQALGRQLDALQQRIAGQEDAYDLVDLALSRRAGVQASLPTYSPVNYPYLSSSFGWRRNPVTGRHAMHEGLDFAAPIGTPIRAASGGIVERARYVSGYGRMVEIDHGNGLKTRYAHASSLNVKAGDLVRKGQLIAKVGSSGRSTGSHLHFEVRMVGHALDPTLFLAPRLIDTSHLVVASAAADATDPELR